MDSVSESPLKISSKAFAASIRQYSGYAILSTGRWKSHTTMRSTGN